jgi:hypothetical protein
VAVELILSIVNSMAFVLHVIYFVTIAMAFLIKTAMAATIFIAIKSKANQLSVSPAVMIFKDII